jgi:hypothetical protein
LGPPPRAAARPCARGGAPPRRRAAAAFPSAAVPRPRSFRRPQGPNTQPPNGPRPLLMPAAGPVTHGVFAAGAATCAAFARRARGPWPLAWLQLNKGRRGGRPCSSGVLRARLARAAPRGPSFESNPDFCSRRGQCTAGGGWHAGPGLGAVQGMGWARGSELGPGARGRAAWWLRLGPGRAWAGAVDAGPSSRSGENGRRAAAGEGGAAGASLVPVRCIKPGGCGSFGRC